MNEASFNLFLGFPSVIAASIGTAMPHSSRRRIGERNLLSFREESDTLNATGRAIADKGAQAMDRSCGKCGGAMSLGVIVDHGYGSNFPERWQPGEARVSWFGGLKEHKKQQIDVETYRCDRCGFLESYAAASK